MTIISTTVGRNPLEDMEGLSPGQPKSLKCSTWMQSQKQQNDLSLFPRQTIQYHSNPSLCPYQNAEDAEVEQFYEDIQVLMDYKTTQNGGFEGLALIFSFENSKITTCC